MLARILHLQKLSLKGLADVSSAARDLNACPAKSEHIQEMPWYHEEEIQKPKQRKAHT